MELVEIINEYLSDKKQLQTEDDYINISEGTIVTWSFANIPQPTQEELDALALILQGKKDAEALRMDRLAVGKAKKEACDNAFNIIVAFNDDAGVSSEDLDAMEVTFAPIIKCLLNSRPATAKTLISAVTPSGAITQAMKDAVLYELRDY